MGVQFGLGYTGLWLVQLGSWPVRFVAWLRGLRLYGAVACSVGVCASKVCRLVEGSAVGVRSDAFQLGSVPV